MRKVTVLIKPTSANCNLRCKYCFYFDVEDNRKEKICKRLDIHKLDIMIKNISSDLTCDDELTIAFQGGEPTLIGVDFYYNFIKKMEGIKDGPRIKYLIQTNGFKLDDEWFDLFRENDFLVGLSLDCIEHIHNKYRTDGLEKGTFNEVLITKEKLEQHQVEYNILSVLTSDLANYPDEVFKFILESGIKYIQFILCVDSLDENTRHMYALNGAKMYKFYSVIFELWLIELSKGNYISIKLFDDILMLLLYGQETACGMLGRCNMQNIIEADGSVYPCDFYALDEFRVGSIYGMSLKELHNSEKVQNFIESKEELPKICYDCRYFHICFGGCKRVRNIYIDKTQNICYYSKLLSMFLPHLNDVVVALKKLENIDIN